MTENNKLIKSRVSKMWSNWRTNRDISKIIDNCSILKVAANEKRKQAEEMIKKADEYDKSVEQGMELIKYLRKKLI